MNYKTTLNLIIEYPYLNNNFKFNFYEKQHQIRIGFASSWHSNFL